MPNEDDIATRRIEKIPWLPPVDSVEDLPTQDVPEGTMCFVEAEGQEEVYQYTNGAWMRVDML